MNSGYLCQGTALEKQSVTLLTKVFFFSFLRSFKHKLESALVFLVCLYVSVGQYLTSPQMGINVHFLGIFAHLFTPVEIIGGSL